MTLEADLGQHLRFGVLWYQGTTLRQVWSSMTTVVIPWLKDPSTILTENSTAAPVKGKLVAFNRGRMEGWFGTPDRTLQWQRCSAGTCTDITGATGYVYRVTAADVGKTLKVKFTLTANINHYLQAYQLSGETTESGTVTG